MKPSDHPLSPFNPNYKAKIEWRAQNLDKQRGDTVTRLVNDARKRNHEPGATNVTGRNPHGLLDPKHFHVYMKARPSK